MEKVFNGCGVCPVLDIYRSTLMVEGFRSDDRDWLVGTGWGTIACAVLRANCYYPVDDVLGTLSIIVDDNEIEGQPQVDAELVTV